MDDSLDNVINIKLNSGRSLTPQLKRHNTPQKTSSRNNSATRTRSTPKTIQLTRLTYESQKCNQQLKQHVSKRIKQRWENDNLFGLRIFMSKKISRKNNNNEENENDSDEEFEWKDTGIIVNWQSMFSELLLEENSELLKSYLACTSSFTPSTLSSFSLSSSNQYKSKSLEDCISQWEKAEFSWIKLEKKLRAVVKTSILNQANARSFVLLIEDLLLEMEDHMEKIRLNTDDGNKTNSKKNIPFIYSLPNEMQHLFLRPIKFITTSRSTNFQITLINSSYHRLLLHATCQFHGRTSKSITEKDSKTGETFRVTNVSSTISRKGKHTVSLVPFIFSHYSDNVNDDMNQNYHNDSIHNNDNGNNNHNNSNSIESDDFEYECITVATVSHQE